MSKLATARRLFGSAGVLAVLAHTIRVIGKWWRKGEPWQIAGKTPIARLDGCRFSIGTGITPMARELLLSGEYEKPERLLIRRYLDRRFPVIELGGNIGVVSCIANRLLEVPNRHLVIEANPGLIPILEQHRQMNRCGFQIVNRALGYGAESIVLQVDEENPLASTAYSLGDTGRKIEVPTTNLASLTAEHAMQRFSLICDIEGLEFEMIEREAALLGERAVAIFVEVHERLAVPDGVRNLQKRLEACGFQFIERNWDTLVFLHRTATAQSPSRLQ